MSQVSLVSGHDALAFFQNWDSCDFVLAKLNGQVTVRGTPESASLTLPILPGESYFDSHGGRREVLRHYWSGLLRGMPKGYDPRLSTGLDQGRDGKDWVVSAAYGGKPSGKITADDVLGRVHGIFDQPTEALAMVRQTSRNAGALYMFVAREIMRAYDATGEQLVREGVRGIGRERGTALKEKHLREGKPVIFRRAVGIRTASTVRMLMYGEPSGRKDCRSAISMTSSCTRRCMRPTIPGQWCAGTN
jgi:hypothetical protein